jgi:hypothetical protein
MKNFFLFLFISLTGSLFISSCYYDKEQLLYGTGVCNDTITTATYSQHVVPILQQYCYSCHSGSFPSGNVIMGTYAADKSLAQNGSLYGSINHTSGYVPMPQGGARLGSCQIARIKKWVDSGSLNN